MVSNFKTWQLTPDKQIKTAVTSSTDDTLDYHQTVARASILHETFFSFIRLSKTGHIVGSPVAGGRHPVLCPEHISKTTLARVMKFHGWIDLIQGECSAQES